MICNCYQLIQLSHHAGAIAMLNLDKFSIKLFDKMVSVGEKFRGSPKGIFVHEWRYMQSSHQTIDM